MPNFEITDEIISKIAEQYNVGKQTVEQMNEIHKKFALDMKLQYLAHIIRTMEEQLRYVSGNEFFRIVCSPVQKNYTEFKEYGIARSHYFKNRYFTIYYHPETDERELRLLLAHELGHLFLVELANSIIPEKQFDEKTSMEPLATIWGIFTIFDKNEFYHNKTIPYRHASSEAILNDFKLIYNQKMNKFNLSE